MSALCLLYQRGSVTPPDQEPNAGHTGRSKTMAVAKKTTKKPAAKKAVKAVVKKVAAKKPAAKKTAAKKTAKK